MATSAYEDVLRGAQQLTPEEQRRLLKELEGELASESEAALLPPARRLTDDERAVVQKYLDDLDALAAEIGAAWQDGMSAVDAVREQRREL